MSHYTQLNIKERRQISAYLSMGKSVSSISERLNRHISTIYREIARNSQRSGYKPIQAHQQAHKRKHRKPIKLVVGSTLYKYVLSRLKTGWSPEQIAGRLKQGKHANRISHESIYQYIYRHGRAQLFSYLPTQRAKRKARHQRKKRAFFKGIRAYKNRPFLPSERAEIGHWEGDTIRFSGNRMTSITTLVDRKSRFLVMCKNERSLSKIVMNNMIERLKHFPIQRCRTITFDQGSEFASCHMLERKKQCRVFYADVSSPWQRGTNENTNRRIRRFLPKKTKISEIQNMEIREIEYRLNNTPRKCLGFLTPYEVFYGAKLNALALRS